MQARPLPTLSAASTVTYPACGQTVPAQSAHIRSQHMGAHRGDGRWSTGGRAQAVLHHRARHPSRDAQTGVWFYSCLPYP
jgi:hypothetical protein